MMAPELEGWLTLTEAAEELDISRQHCWRMANSGKWKTLKRIGTKDVFVVEIAEVERKKGTVV